MSRIVINVNWLPVRETTWISGSICRAFCFTSLSLGFRPMRRVRLFQICNIFFQKCAHFRACYQVYESSSATSQWSLLLLLFLPYPLSVVAGTICKRTPSVWIVLVILKATSTAIISEIYISLVRKRIHNREVFYCFQFCVADRDN